MSDESWHGTVGGYNNYRCRCPRCSEAKADYMRSYFYGGLISRRVPVIANKVIEIKSRPTLAEWKASRHADK